MKTEIFYTLLASTAVNGFLHGPERAAQGWSPNANDCPWMQPTDQYNVFGCNDGTQCNGISTNLDCCAGHGGRSQCPFNYPIMCNSQSCAGGEHCCSTEPNYCSGQGGARQCQPPPPPQDPCKHLPCGAFCKLSTNTGNPLYCSGTGTCSMPEQPNKPPVYIDYCRRNDPCVHLPCGQYCNGNTGDAPLYCSSSGTCTMTTWPNAPPSYSNYCPVAMAVRHTNGDGEMEAPARLPQSDDSEEVDGRRRQGYCYPANSYCVSNTQCCSGECLYQQEYPYSTSGTCTSNGPYRYTSVQTAEGTTPSGLEYTYKVDSHQ